MWVYALIIILLLFREVTKIFWREGKSSFLFPLLFTFSAETISCKETFKYDNSRRTNNRQIQQNHSFSFTACYINGWRNVNLNDLF